MRILLVVAILLSPATVKAQLTDYFPRSTDPGARLHDGLFLRFTAGTGAAYDRFDGPLWDEGTSLSVTSALGASVGYSLLPGLSVSGSLIVDAGVATRVEVLGERVSNAIEIGSLFVFGAAIDGYPDPGGGFHVGLMGGFALTTIRDKSGARTDHVPLGGAAFGNIGHDWWIGDDWSLGVALRVGGALLSAEDVSHLIAISALSLTATLN